MPANVVAALAKKHGISTAAAEGHWDRAKKAAAKYKKQGDEHYWRVVTTVFKKMVGEELDIFEKALMNEIEGFEGYQTEITPSIFGNKT